MVYLISDIHGDKNFDGLKKYMSIATDDDLLIVLGDVELSFYNNDQNSEFTKEFLNIDKNIAFIDGNHDNHPYVNSFPIEEWNGGKIHRLTKNVVHLIRGNVYTIESKKIFVMGGCKSSQKWYDSGLVYDGEVPTEREISVALDNLRRNNNTVDYVLTHKYWDYSDCNYSDFTLEWLTNYIDKNVKFKKWYSGHWHCEKNFDDKHFVIYDALTKI